MTKKDRKSKKINEREIESAVTDPSETIGESTPFDTHPQEEVVDKAPDEQTAASLENESPSEDLLDDVRRSLIEEAEIDRNKKESKWWRRIGRKEKSTEPEPLPSTVEIDLPDALLQTERAEDLKQATEPDEYGEQINSAGKRRVPNRSHFHPLLK